MYYYYTEIITENDNWTLCGIYCLFYTVQISLHFSVSYSKTLKSSTFKLCIIYSVQKSNFPFASRINKKNLLSAINAKKTKYLSQTKNWHIEDIPYYTWKKTHNKWANSNFNSHLMYVNKKICISTVFFLFLKSKSR